MKFLFVFCLLIFISHYPLYAQEEASLDWDIDSIFDEPFPEVISPPEETVSALPPLLAQLRQRSFTFDASFQFMAGIAPGFADPPWQAGNDNEFSWGQNIRMRAEYALDFQISEVFRVRNTFFFEVPNFHIRLGDFFFDYIFYDRIFLRAGKFYMAWGISPNFPFTNLLARVPSGEYHVDYEGYYRGDSYIARVDIPFGIGGLQLLAMTRADLLSSNPVTPGWRHIGYGAKYNLALRRADIDFGLFYHDFMPFRSFLSIKTTIGNTELYNEWLAANINRPEYFSGAVNFGFIHEFFDRRLMVNGEIFYNREGDSFWRRPESILREADIFSFIEGPNFALNLLYRIRGKGNPRIFVQGLFAPAENSARLIPGFRLTPWQNAEFYFAVPMDLGSASGFYRQNPEDPHGRNFSVVMLLNFSGSTRVRHTF